MDSQDGTACTKSGLWDYFFDARRFQIDLYTFTEQYELAISEANKMKQKALDIDNNRGMVAALSACPTHTSAASAGTKDSKRWKKPTGCFQRGNAVVRISVLSQLISVTKEMKDNNQATEIPARTGKCTLQIHP